MSDLFLGWLQLKKEKIRFLVALLGVGFAVTLILMQVGFREAMFDSGVRMHRSWIYDLVLVSPETVSLIGSKSFTSRRLYQAQALEDVESVQPVYLQHGLWKDVDTGDTRDLFVIGFDPAKNIFNVPEVSAQLNYVFGFGIFIGLVVGSIIVYQILFADVSDHLPEYATLKAMGYSNFYLFTVVIQQALVLAVLGFVPGFALSLLLYDVASDALMIELRMEQSRALMVLAITVGMGTFSALLVLRKIHSADPATIF